MPSQTFDSTKPISKIIALLAGGTALFWTIQTPRASAGYPTVHLVTSYLSVDVDQCTAKAQEAANLILSRVDEPQFDAGTMYLFGGTTGVTTTFVCTPNEIGSVLVVVSSGDDLHDYVAKEAGSIAQRIQIFLFGS